MRKILLPIMLVLLSAMSSFELRAQWSGTSSITTNTSGAYVGIGATPLGRLHVKSAGSGWDDHAIFESSTGGKWQFLVDGGASNKFRIRNRDSGTEVLTFATDGKIGFGTASPTVRYTFKASGAGYDDHFGLESSTGNTWQFLVDGGSSNQLLIRNKNSSTTAMEFLTNGNINMSKKLSTDQLSSYPVGTGYAIEGYQVNGVAGHFTGEIGVEAWNTNDAGAVCVKATNFSGSGKAIYGQDTGGGGGFTWAGYFSGDVYCTGSYLPSDRKFKENEKEIMEALDILKSLKPKSYNYKTEEFKTSSFHKGKSVGFIAQEVQEVLPELVIKISNPAEKDAQGKIIKEKEESLGINYIGFIPYIVSGIQELKKINENQSETIEKLLSQNEKLVSQLEEVNKRLGIEDAEKGKAIRLYQNSPNPFDQATTIKYSISSEHTNANIFVYNLNGEQIKKFELTSKGEGKIDINGGELKAGMYIYSLIVDGKEVETKRMILTK